MTSSRHPLYLAVGAILLALGAYLLVPAEEGGQRPHFDKSSLTITRADGKAVHFDVEIARTAAEQEYGLMHLSFMPKEQGMIFPYDPPREVAFWMKNTLIPLDMLFIDASGRVGRIVTHARPNDLTPVSSQIMASAVIEVNGGAVEQYGFAVGDKVDYPPDFKASIR